MSVWRCVSVFSVCPLSPVIRHHMFPHRDVAVGQMMSVSLCRSIHLPTIQPCDLSASPSTGLGGGLPLGSKRAERRALKPHPSTTKSLEAKQVICIGAETSGNHPYIYIQASTCVRLCANLRGLQQSQCGEKVIPFSFTKKHFSIYTHNQSYIASQEVLLSH